MTYSEKLKDPRWQKKRLEILNRDEWNCRFCGEEEKTLHVHHISYFGDPWEAPDKMLITLCKECHQKEDKSFITQGERLIKILKKSGFTSRELHWLADCLQKNPETYWADNDLIFDVFEYILSDNKLILKLADDSVKKRIKKYKGGSNG
jgi:hypothetical protein